MQRLFRWLKEKLGLSGPILKPGDELDKIVQLDLREIYHTEMPAVPKSSSLRKLKNAMRKAITLLNPSIVIIVALVTILIWAIFGLALFGRDFDKGMYFSETFIETLLPLIGAGVLIAFLWITRKAYRKLLPQKQEKPLQLPFKEFLKEPEKIQKLVMERLTKLITNSRDELLAPDESFNQTKTRLERAIDEANSLILHWKAQERSPLTSGNAAYHLARLTAEKANLVRALEILRGQQKRIQSFYDKALEYLSRVEPLIVNVIMEERTRLFLEESEQLQMEAREVATHHVHHLFSEINQLKQVLAHFGEEIKLPASSEEGMLPAAKVIVEGESALTQAIDRLEEQILAPDALSTA